MSEIKIPEDLREMAGEAQERICLFNGTPMTDADQRVMYLIGRIGQAEAERDELKRQLYRCSSELNVLLAGEQSDAQVSELKKISMMTDEEVDALLAAKVG